MSQARWINCNHISVVNHRGSVFQPLGLNVCFACRSTVGRGSILPVLHIGNATRPAPAPIVIRGKAYLKNRTIIGSQANALICVNYATDYAEARSPSDIPSDRRECCDFAE